MVEEERNVMIPRPSAAIEKIGSGPGGILSSMVAFRHFEYLCEAGTNA